MKKMFFKPVALILSLSIFSNITFGATKKSLANSDNATQCGHAMVEVIKSFNDLQQDKYCELMVILNSQATNEEKTVQIENNPNLIQFKNSIVQAYTKLHDNFASEVMADETLKQIAVKTAGLDLGYGDLGTIIDGGNDPCAAYKSGQNLCLATLGVCLADVAGICVFATLAYPACFAAGAAVCASVAGVCAENNDKNHPNCVPGGVFHWNPHMITAQPGSICNE